MIVIQELNISKDPIGLAENNPNLYAYIYESNTMVDPFGLDIIKDAWKVVEQNINNSKTTTVLGHFANISKGETFNYISKKQ